MVSFIYGEPMMPGHGMDTAGTRQGQSVLHRHVAHIELCIQHSENLYNSFPELAS